MWKTCCVAALILVHGLPALAAGLNQPPVPAPLSVSIVLPDGNVGTDSSAIEIGNPTDHFDVVVQNVSDKPLYLWEYGCPWGFDDVSLEVTSVNGKPLAKPIVVAHGASFWSASEPVTVMLPPHGIIVREVHLYLNDHVPQKSADGRIEAGYIPAGEIYMNFPLPEKGGREQVTMRAAFEIGPDPWTKKSDVWLGRVVSETKEYIVLWNH